MKCVVYNNMVRGRKIGEFKALSQCSAVTDGQKSLQESVTEIMP